MRKVMIILLLVSLVFLSSCKTVNECSADVDCPSKCSYDGLELFTGVCKIVGQDSICDYSASACPVDMVCSGDKCVGTSLANELIDASDDKITAANAAVGSGQVTCFEQHKKVEFTVVSSCKNSFTRTVPKCTDSFPFYSTKELEVCEENSKCVDPNVEVSNGRKFYPLGITERASGAYCLSSLVDDGDDSVDDLQDVTVLA